MNTLAAYFNFSWTPIYANRIWSKIVNGTQIGMIGDVFNGKADLSIGFLSMTHERNQLVDFTMPYAIEPNTFLSRNIQIKSKYGLMTFFVQNDSISYGILFMVMFSAITITLFELIINKTIKKSRLDQGNKPKFKCLSRFKSSLFITLEALLIQPQISYRLHKKVFSTFWLVFGMIYLIIYSTFIFSSLIREADPIKSIEELRIAVNDGRVRIWYFDVGNTISGLLKVKNKLSNLI